ncbi:MAG: H-NS histone family protein [Proteobacteria bacterium]|nr:H-NS histone family protein [Pseudomonadota bacterium]
MNAIKKLSGKDLTKLIDQASKELIQRKRMDVLSKDIQRVIAKHKVSKSELASLIDMIRFETKVSKKTKTRAASKVPAKFKNPNGQETWTGRGRAPNWVSEICQTTGITVTEFKTSSAYLITE